MSKITQALKRASADRQQKVERRRIPRIRPEHVSHGGFAHVRELMGRWEQAENRLAVVECIADGLKQSARPISGQVSQYELARTELRREVDTTIQQIEDVLFHLSHVLCHTDGTGACHDQSSSGQ